MIKMNVIAVDVGTTSVRLAIISFQGNKFQKASILASAKQDIEHYQDGSRFEQSSKNIWDSICQCSRSCLAKSSIDPCSIRSIAFSATCSLVICEEKENSENDVIMWMDHRAIEEARIISESGDNVLQQLGGTCSPEFSLAKLFWLKEHEPQRFSSASGLFELPDWLVYKCIGGCPLRVARSLCCVTCKWGYNSEAGSHCDLIDSNKQIVEKIGDKVLSPGTISGYLNSESASELGLMRESNKENFGLLKIAVATSLIDAHSGMLAMLSIPLIEYQVKQKLDSTLCSLAGTSTCNMLLSKTGNFTRGIWGPYKDVVIQGYYLLEAGQSMTGKLIEISIESHEEGKRRLASGEPIYDIIGHLNEQTSSFNARGNLHVLPSYHGNRSPLANPRLKGGIYGLSIGPTKSLLEYYIATVESLCYETKLIIEAIGSNLDTVLVSGGLMKNSFYMQTLADVIKCQVANVSLADVDFMVMGSGLIARHAALISATNDDKHLSKESIENIQYEQLKVNIYEPNLNLLQYHIKRYACFKEFVNFSQRVDEILHS